MYLFKFLINNSKNYVLTFCLFGVHYKHQIGKRFPKEYYEIKDKTNQKTIF